MTPAQSFKFAFLCRCAEEGLDAAQIQDRISHCRTKLAGATDLGLSALAFASLPTALSVGGGALAGTMIGSHLGGMTLGKRTPADVRRRELIAALNSYSEQAERRALQHRADLAKPTPRFYGM